jgi:hypothetical protein
VLQGWMWGRDCTRTASAVTLAGETRMSTVQHLKVYQSQEDRMVEWVCCSSGPRTSAFLQILFRSWKTHQPCTRFPHKQWVGRAESLSIKTTSNGKTKDGVAGFSEDMHKIPVQIA